MIRHNSVAGCVAHNNNLNVVTYVNFVLKEACVTTHDLIDLYKLKLCTNSIPECTVKSYAIHQTQLLQYLFLF